MTLDDYNLSEWPFRTTADENFAFIWAGRPKTKQQLDRLLLKMPLIPKSSLHILWANFGMGKTHTLYHLKYRCQQTKGQIIPIYAVMPKRSTGFIELYREIVQAFLGDAELRDYLGRQLVDLGQNSKGASVAMHPMFSKSPGVVKALLAIRNGDIEETTAAQQWLTAQPGLPAWAMNSIGVNYRIKTPEDAINALSSLINLVVSGGTRQKQLLLMIDEFQRIGELRPIIASQVNSSLHTVFNAHPTKLQMILTFSVGKKENVDYLLSAELKSRAEPQSINLDVLSREEAVGFLADLFGQFRIRKDDPRPLYPFSQAAVNAILRTIGQKKSLTPRRINSYASHVLSEHMVIANDSVNEISEAEVISLLSSAELGELDNDSQ